MTTHTLNGTLLQRFIGNASWTQSATVVIAGSLLLWLSARIQVPF